MTSTPQTLDTTDFSERAVRQAVVRLAVQKSYSLYPTVLGVLCGIGGFLFTSTEALLIGGAGVGFGLGSMIINLFFRSRSLARAHLEALHRQHQTQIEQIPARLRRQFEALGFETGILQIDKLKTKFDGLKEVLDAKFSPTELTYGRYLAVAEQVHLAALDRLADIAALLTSVKSIDPAYITSRLAELGGSDSPERATLRTRLQLHQETMAKSAALAVENETAMTALDTTAVRLAEVRTQQGQAKVSMETAMTELLSLAERSHLYERH